nr:uncharacterized protein LOC124224839 [Neodiprion pinetum]
MPLFSRSCNSKARLDGKTVIITGANSGIGKETAGDLYRRGARVILACRDLARAKAAVKDIYKSPPSKYREERFIGEFGQLVVYKLDLNSLASIRECAKQIWKTEPAVHILINNAAVMMVPKGVTEDGFEIQFGINHLGHFLFTLLLLPKIIQSQKHPDTCGRIINVSSSAHNLVKIKVEDLMSDKTYNPFMVYCRSKLANILFTRELTRRLKGCCISEANVAGVNTYTLHPGIFKSNLSRHFDQVLFRGVRFFIRIGELFVKTPKEGAQTTIHCAVDEGAAKQTGLYYSQCAVAQPSNAALNDLTAIKLWNASIELVGLPTSDLRDLIQIISKEYAMSTPGINDVTRSCASGFVSKMWPFSRSCQSTARLVGRTVVITGANTGIGKETARDLYRRGARVVLACRDLNKANAAIEELKSVPPSCPTREQFVGEPGEVVACKLDLNSLASVRECAKHISTTESAVHVLINNAGVMMCPKGVTEDGFETQLGTNHLGHFLFTLLLLPKIIQSRKDSDPCSRIINVSSMAHARGDINFDDLMSEKSYSPLKAYNQSKVANVLFTRELARRLKEANITGINVYTLHPGVIKSDLGRHLSAGPRFLLGIFRPFIKNIEQGAQTTIHCAVDEEAAKETGLYYKECAPTSPSSVALDDAKAARLWDTSIKLVGLPTHNLTELIEQVSKDYIK